MKLVLSQEYFIQNSEDILIFELYSCDVTLKKLNPQNFETFSKFIKMNSAKYKSNSQFAQIISQI